MNVSGGDTNVITYFMMRLAADGTAATGLTITTFDLQYTRTGAAAVTKVDATALSTSADAHADNKMIEVDATSSPGLYRVDWPDAAFAAGVIQVHLALKYDSTVFTEVLAVDIDAPVNVTTVSGSAEDIATATALATAQVDLDTMAGADGTTLSSSQPNYAPNTTTPPTAAAIVNEWESQSQADPTGFHVNAMEINSNTTCAAKLALSADTIVSGAAQTGTLSTTVMTTDLTEATDDHYNGRIIIWTGGVLQNQATDITDYSGTNGTLTYTATTEAPSNTDPFIIV